MAGNLRKQQNTGKISAGPPPSNYGQQDMYGDYDEDGYDDDYYENDYGQQGMQGMGGMNMTGGARTMGYGQQPGLGGAMNQTGGMYGGAQGRMGQTGMSNLTQSKASYGQRPLTGMQGTMQSGYKTGFGQPGQQGNPNMAVGYDYDSDDFDDGDLDYIDQMEGRPGMPQGGYAGQGQPGNYGMDMAGMNMGSDDYDDYDDEDDDAYGGNMGGMVADRNAFSDDDDDDEIDLDFDFDKNKREYKKKEEEEKKKEQKAKEEEEKKKKEAGQKKKEAEEKKKKAEDEKRKREEDAKKREGDAKKRDGEKKKNQEKEDRERRIEVDRIKNEQMELARKADDEEKQNRRDRYYDDGVDINSDDDVNSEISNFGKEDYNDEPSYNKPVVDDAEDGYDDLLADLIAEQENQERDMYDGQRKPQQSETQGYSNDFEGTEDKVEELKSDNTIAKKASVNKPELKNSNFSFQPKDSNQGFDGQKIEGNQSPFTKNPIPGQHLVNITPGTYSGYAAEALLHDEQNAKKHLGTTLEMERDKAKSWEKQYWLLKEEKEKLNTFHQHLSNSKDVSDKELNEMKILKGQYEAEIDELTSQLDIKDMKVDELQRANRALDGFNAQKERLLKEKREITEKSYINSTLDTMKKQHELEIESLNIKNEMLQRTLDSAEEKINELEGNVKDGTGNLRMHAYHEHNVNDLKSQIAMLSNKLYQKDRMKKLDDEDDDNNKEIILMDIMIKGYAKENEKLIDENKHLKESINKLNEKAADDKKEFNQTYAKMTHGSWMNNPETELKDNVKRLKDDLYRKDDYFKQKIEEMESYHRTDMTKMHTTWKDKENRLVDEINRKIMENDTLKSQNNTGQINNKDDKRFPTRKNSDKKLEELEEINRELENDLQENQTKIEDLEANILDMTKYYEKQGNSSQNNKAMDNLKKENKRLTNLAEELKKKTPPKENKDTTKQIEELKKDNRRLKELSEDYRKRAANLEKQKTPSITSTPTTNKKKVPTKVQSKGALTKQVEDDEIFINTENMFNMLDKAETQDSDEFYYDWNNQHNHYLLSKLSSLLDTVLRNCPNTLLTNCYNDIKIISEVGANIEINSRVLDAIDRLQESVRSNRSINFSQEKYLNTTIAIKDVCDKVSIFLPNKENYARKIKYHIYDLQRIFTDDILGHLPEMLAYKFSQNNNTQSQTNNFMSNGSNLEVERIKRANIKLQEEISALSIKNAELSEVIQKIGPSPSATDFALLSKRLEIMEKNQKLKALEVQEGIKNMNFTLPGTGQNINFEREKQKYAEIIRKKNRDIAVFRHELDSLLQQIEELKKKGCSNCNYVTR